MGPRHDNFPLVLKTLLTIALIVVIMAAAYRLMHLLVLVFGAVVIGVLIRGLADAIERRTPLDERGGFYAALLVILLFFAGFFYLFGSQIRAQYSQVIETVPVVWEQIEGWLETVPGGSFLLTSLERISIDDSSIFPSIPQVLGSIAGFLTNFVLLLFGALFIASNPGMYHRGLVMLIPKARRQVTGEALSLSGSALKLWMKGQFVSMTVVGVLTGVGLWIVGVPAPVALGLIMGVAEAIPWVGPWLGGIPIVIMALAAGPEEAFWAIVVVLLVQQAESILVTPLVQKRAVSLPPAVTVFGIIAGGILFGPAGLLFAAPLLVVIFVLVKRLYVEETLDTPTDVPGRDD